MSISWIPSGSTREGWPEDKITGDTVVVSTEEQGNCSFLQHLLIL